VPYRDSPWRIGREYVTIHKGKTVVPQEDIHVEITITKVDQVIWDKGDSAGLGDLFDKGFTALVNGSGPVTFVPVDSSRNVRKAGGQTRGLKPQRLSIKDGSSREAVKASKEARKAWTMAAYGSQITLLTE
jgi:hypothetical protein